MKSWNWGVLVLFIYKFIVHFFIFIVPILEITIDAMYLGDILFIGFLWLFLSKGDEDKE